MSRISFRLENANELAPPLDDLKVVRYVDDGSAYYILVLNFRQQYRRKPREAFYSLTECIRTRFRVFQRALECSHKIRE